ncbi:putative motility protein YjfB-like [Chromohalobacter marismortui]|uniref:Putative motility protein YjfB-like n=1 Tax=Chromohalobacter marismortui TaxID=42055 RepID=A0A4R7NJF7_9GAMM|nr:MULTISPECIES: putative motility protein [Chromohalobacter]MCI0511490.1 YjfB family protein [Chromohalobacter sp.]MCI0594415.1 YjfB family protein [Chromohalobacter sp.]TDU20431.1 putative motility protein YjfB-like [Chromohalobacter marismortui]
MDTSVNAAVGTAMALQQHNAEQQAQASLLKESLNNQASHVSQLMEAVSPQQSLAVTGTVGTQVNTYA